MSDVHRVYCGIHEGERCDCRPCAPASGEPLTDAAKLAMFDTVYARCVRAEAAMWEAHEALRWFAECKLSEDNCASFEVANRRIQGIARRALSEAHWKARATEAEYDLRDIRWLMENEEQRESLAAAVSAVLNHERVRAVRAEAALLERDAAVQRVGEAWDRYISENVGGGWYKRLGEAMAALRALSGARPGETT